MPGADRFRLRKQPFRLLVPQCRAEHGSIILQDGRHVGVRPSERLPPDRQRLAVEGLRRIISALLRTEPCQVIEIESGFRVGPPPRALHHRQRPPEERFGFREPALFLIQERHVVERGGHVRMLQPQRLLLVRQRPAQERLGFVIPMLLAVDRTQVVQVNRRLGVRRSQDRLLDRQRPLIVRFCLSVLPLMVRERPQVTEAARHPWLLQIPRLLIDLQRPAVKRFRLDVLPQPGVGQCQTGVGRRPPSVFGPIPLRHLQRLPIEPCGSSIATLLMGPVRVCGQPLIHRLLEQHPGEPVRQREKAGAQREQLVVHCLAALCLTRRGWTHRPLHQLPCGSTNQ
jgi:hypothetical protein